jgi:hypothetical protein
MTMENLTQVAAHLPQGIPAPFDAYLAGRNSYVAGALAEGVGAENLGVRNTADLPADLAAGVYSLLYKHVPLAMMNELQINNPEQHIFGAALEHPALVDKVNLHPTLAGTALIPGISRQFLAEVEGLVLPGYAVGSTAEIAAAFACLQECGYGVRLKSANASNGEDQFNVGSARETIARYSAAGMDAAVLEAQVRTETGQPPRNLSFNTFFVPGLGEVCTVGRQLDIIGEDSQVIYGGALVTVLRGSVAKAFETAQQSGQFSAEELIALRNAGDFITTYHRHYNSVARHSVLGVDTLSGSNFVGKVVDIRARVGGTDPIVALGAQTLIANPDLQLLSGEVVLNYGQENFNPNPEVECMNYIHPGDDSKSLQITVRMQS